MQARQRRVPPYATPGVGAPTRASYLGKQANLQEREIGAADPCRGRGDYGGKGGRESSTPPCAPEGSPERRAAGSRVLDACTGSFFRPASAPRGADPRDSGAAERRQPARPGRSRGGREGQGSGSHRGSAGAKRRLDGSRQAGWGSGLARRSGHRLRLRAPLSCKPR